ncbi:hypothetical protein [Gracilimonas mengyeensis]|uniref:Lipoprotein n=1 Tax=Gracilimonas mengyeensis TaxID=1302730 RepID=A0A521FB37_9BACT|nr:hypothetical protein [Gracilimonas mengyeensis]SMO93412.1 hypothetical protein SAMN06265219_11693 [Gracilimonas mengyeensis]
MYTQKLHLPLAALLICILALTGCKDSGSGSNKNNAYNGLAVRVVNTGSGDLELSQDSDASTGFCYQEDGCPTSGGGSFHTVFEGQDTIMDSSDPDGQAVGVQVGFHVDAGSGYFEIVEGKAYRDDAGFLEFEAADVVYTSDEFSAETVSFPKIRPV